MPGLPERTRISSSKDNNGSTDSTNSLAVLSNDNRPQYGLSYNQLEEFWCGLTQHDRKKLLRINKQTLLENARKRMYCSRCNGLLLEGYLQIVMYGKSTKQDMPRERDTVRTINVQNDTSLCAEDDCQDDAYDPSVHPWGGLTTARDETLTLLDCYICSKSLKGVQNVFDSAYARERDRELLYPDACGGTSRGWITQGTTGFGRGHVSRETCALHTARLSVRTLVDFWSALGEETRHSLMRMKEEDFIERLMYRFDNKRFCRDCRRNVIREFKELKELKRMRKEPRCTIWFCAADTEFQYEVSDDTVKVDWNQTFLDSFGTYHHFEWAIGTGEGKADILDFEDVGLSVRVQVNGLDLSDLSACYITLRAWKMNGRCNELCVKAHALRGQHCVHSRLVVGDGFVSITQGESIERFFEHAEEAEEEEDDDSMDKDGNDFDGECSRPQKHAKSPELAREFLLDAATVIFKEQVSKAFREGTTRQNAHIIFVSLALQLLEERLHVACKEIYTIENQKKLLEEEEKEKRMEEKLRERQERKRTKEREKKLRKKERLREKENKCVESSMDTAVTDAPVKDATGCPDDSPNFSHSTASETSEPTQTSPLSPDVQDDELLTEFIYSKTEEHTEDSLDRKFGNTGDWNSSFSYDHHKYSRRNMKFQKDSQPDWINWSGRRKGDALPDNGTRHGADDFDSTRSTDGSNKQLSSSAMKSNTRIAGQKMGKKCQCSYTCRCYYQNEHKPRPASYATRTVQEPKYVSKSESTLDISKPYYRGNKYSQVECSREVGSRTKSYINGNPSNAKKVWEPLDSQKKYVRRNSDSDVTLKSTSKVEASESDQFGEFSGVFHEVETDISVSNNQLDDDISAKSLIFSRKAVSENGELSLDSSTNSSSNSDNCSSCLIEGDSNTQNLELASGSDSEESSQTSDGKETTHCFENGLTECGVTTDTSGTAASDHDAGKMQQEQTCAKAVSSNHLNPKVAPYIGNGGNIVVSASPPPQMHNQTIHYPVFQAPTIGYYPQSPVSWPVGPANGLMSFPHANHYLFPNGYGYGLNGNAQFTQYGTLQHLAPPLLSPVHAPIFQPVPRFNEVGSKEESKVLNVGGQKDVQCDTERVASTDQLHGPAVLDAAERRKPQKMDKGNDGFSLFHFGGPVALSTGFEAEPVSLKREISPKKDSMEEYNLFAASNGIKFDIFQLSSE